MVTKSFKIVSPKTFEIYLEDIKANEYECLIKVNKAFICKADIRYYIGDRDKKILGLKYPMNLLHEAIGTVIKGNNNEFKLGDRVVLIPNVIKKCIKKCCIHKVCKDSSLGENYCDKAIFASSNCDGFSKEMIAWPAENILKIQDDLDDNTAIFCELISVAIASIRRCNKINNTDTIYIWGDGILGYITASIFKAIYKKQVIAFGKHEEKLKKFPCNNYFLVDGLKKIESNIKVAFECVGSNGAESSINQILDLISPGGNIILTGVSENNISINTRKILEKGITLTGSTRSNIDDFKIALNYLKNKEFRSYIEKLIIDEVEIKNIFDFYSVFEKTQENNLLGKYVMKFCF